MDTVGSSQVCSVGNKWYVLVIADNYSRYSWVFFLESKDEVFEHFRSLALRLNNEHPNCLKAYEVIMELSSEMPHSISFILNIVLINNFQPHICLNKMGLWNTRNAFLLIWLERCLMSI
jgi:hypothetical protein